MKLGTIYHEDLREITGAHLSNYGINPAAAAILLQSYHQNVMPHPCTIMYEVNIGPIKELVEIHISTPGHIGKNDSAVIGKLDSFGLKLFARSYYENLRPMPLSFLYQGIEVHVRTPSAGEYAHKNIARNIFNPTV